MCCVSTFELEKQTAERLCNRLQEAIENNYVGSAESKSDYHDLHEWVNSYTRLKETFNRAQEILARYTREKNIKSGHR
jgi:hypothetical protein